MDEGCKGKFERKRAHFNLEIFYFIGLRVQGIFKSKKFYFTRLNVQRFIGGKKDVLNGLKV